MEVDTRIRLHDAYGNPLPDVTVEIDGISKITRENGETSWDLDPGYHECVISQYGISFTIPVVVESWSLRINLFLDTTLTPTMYVKIWEIIADMSESLPGVNVIIDGIHIATTDSLGKASFSVVPGTHDFKLEKAGYITIRFNLDILQDMGQVLEDEPYRMWYHMRAGSGESAPPEPTPPPPEPEVCANYPNLKRLYDWAGEKGFIRFMERVEKLCETLG